MAKKKVKTVKKPKANTTSSVKIITASPTGDLDNDMDDGVGGVPDGPNDK